MSDKTRTVWMRDAAYEASLEDGDDGHRRNLAAQLGGKTDG